MSQMPTDRKKPKKDNAIKEFFADSSLNLVFEMVISFIWNVVLFIPRVIVRMISNVY